MTRVFKQKKYIKKVLRKSLKVFFVIFLVISWTFTSLPRIPFINFPPKIKEARAATSLYFPVTEASDVNPAFQTGWNATGQGASYKLRVTKGTDAITVGQIVNITEDTGLPALDRQFVSPPMQAGNVFTSGSTAVSMQLMTREYAAQDDTNRCFTGIRIMSQDGTTLRATLLAVAAYGTTLEFVNNATHRNNTCANGDTVTASYTTVVGDRIVLEVGYAADGADTTPQGSAKWGDNATDLPVNDTQTTDGAGWISFSNNITWQTTTLGPTTDPASATVAPESGIRDAGAFTLQTSNGTDSVTALTVTLAGSGTPYDGLSEVRVTSDNGATLYFTAISNPSSNTLNFSGGTAIPATTTQTQFKIRVTPKTHAGMPVPPGAEYNLSPYVSAWTSGNPNTKAGSDSNANTLTIDNLSPNGATSVSGTAGNAKVTLNWTASNSTDFNTTSGSVIYRWTGGTAGSEVPAEGSTATIGAANGTATTACVVSSAISAVLSKIDGTGGSAECTTAALTNGQAYTYKAFQKDTNGNYDVGVSIGTFTPSAAAAYLTQNNFRFYLTANSVTLTDPWPSGTLDLGEKAALTQLPVQNLALVSGDKIRIKINFGVTVTNLTATTQAFQLEYSAAEDCTTASSWTAVGAKASASIWRLYDETTIGDSTVEANNLGDSTAGAEGYYSEINPSSTNPNAVNTGQYSEWDLPVEDNGAAENTTYCFRMAKSGGGALDLYGAQSYPKLTTAPGTSILMRHGNFFQNEAEKGFFWTN